jgi:N6-adenosine-specific RNA methylase IME4
MTTSLVAQPAIRVADPLAFLVEARQALSRANGLAEVKRIRDKAEALRQYVRAQGESLHFQQQAAELKLRAERRAGELLAEMEKNKGGRSTTDTLSEVGVEHHQSSRWQRIASLPEPTFETFLADTVAAGEELTTAGALRLVKATAKEERRESIAAAAPEATGDLQALVAGGHKFGCIYADPPWKYGNQATRASTDNHYPTMDLDAIAALPISDLAADDAHLHLWTTNGFLFESKAILDAWGFEFRSTFIWCKPQMGIGNYWRNSHEILLTAIRGDAKRFNDRSLKSWETFDRGAHSAKPEKVREYIERASPRPRLELFGRRLADGWTVWGNQVSRTMFDQEEVA